MVTVMRTPWADTLSIQQPGTHYCKCAIYLHIHCNDFINNAALAVPNKQHIIARSMQVEQVVYYIHTYMCTYPHSGWTVTAGTAANK
jgi:hypothetical protein